MGAISPELIRTLAQTGDDFGFEMRVGKILRQLTTAKVEHGGLYQPIGFNQPHRQFDYRMRVAHGNRIIRLAVECKNLFSGSPVVLCGLPRAQSESRLDLVVSDFRIVAQNGLGQQQLVGAPLESCPTSVYRIGDFVGKSVIRPDPSASKEKELVKGTGYRLTGDGDVWEKWNQAVMHAAVLAKAATNEFRQERTFTFTAVLPVVVLPDDCLWTIRYDENGQIDRGPEKALSATLYLGSQHTVADYVTIQLSHIHLMTVSGLHDLVGRLAAVDGPLWKEIFSDTALSGYMTSRMSALNR